MASIQLKGEFLNHPTGDNILKVWNRFYTFEKKWNQLVQFVRNGSN